MPKTKIMPGSLEHLMLVWPMVFPEERLPVYDKTEYGAKWVYYTIGSQVYHSTLAGLWEQVEFAVAEFKHKEAEESNARCRQEQMA